MRGHRYTAPPLTSTCSVVCRSFKTNISAGRKSRKRKLANAFHDALVSFAERRIIKMRNIILNISLVRNFGKKMNIFSQYLQDAVYFSKNFSDSKVSQEKLEYKMLFLIHSIEKGMCIATRPFGESKIKNLMVLLNKYEDNDYDKTTSAYIMSISIIRRWRELLDEKQWNKVDTKLVDNFISRHSDVEYIKVGARDFDRAELCSDLSFEDFENFIVSRHSVRNFSQQKISSEDIKDCITVALNSPSACNRQMISVVQVEDEKKKEILSKAIKGISGFDLDSISYFLILYNTNSLMFYGEREQGSFNAGLFTMNFVNALHAKKIGSCIMQWSNKNKETSIIRKELGIDENKKIVCAIGAGYYAEKSVVPYSRRKQVEEVFTCI